jgi:hypothetical protein
LISAQPELAAMKFVHRRAPALSFQRIGELLAAKLMRTGLGAANSRFQQEPIAIVFK